MDSYLLSRDAKERERNTIKQILHNNKYDPSIIDGTRGKHAEKQRKGKSQIWAKFTYTGKETKFITKLFKKSSVKILFTTNNTVGKILNHKPPHRETRDKLDESGVYSLTCPDCNMKYVGQTGQSFQIWFQEHYCDFKYNNNKPKFAAHLLEEHHSIGHINSIMEVLYVTKKGCTMDTIEKFYIYKETKNGNQINDKNTIKQNRIHDAVIQGENDRSRSHGSPAFKQSNKLVS